MWKACLIGAHIPALEESGSLSALFSGGRKDGLSFDVWAVTVNDFLVLNK